MKSTDLISDELRHMNVQLHKDYTYGNNSAKAWSKAGKIIAEYNCKSALDYGCGKGRLGMQARKKGCEIDWQDYDPAVEIFNILPKPADLVVIRDVIEHVEPEKIDIVLEHIASLTNMVAWFVIPNTKSTKVLSDGRNAHLTQEGYQWWAKRVNKYFDIVDPTAKESFDNICKPKK